MLVKRMNRRGEDPGLSGFVVTIAIAGLFLALIVVAVWYFSGRTGETVSGIDPGQESIIITACQGFASVDSPGAKDSFCTELRDDGNGNYVTCSYSSISGALTREGLDVPDCAPFAADLESESLKVCAELSASKKSSVTINDVSCASIEASAGDAIVSFSEVGDITGPTDYTDVAISVRSNKADGTQQLWANTQVTLAVEPSYSWIKLLPVEGASGAQAISSVTTDASGVAHFKFFVDEMPSSFTENVIVTITATATDSATGKTGTGTQTITIHPSS